jgi:FixJ family two-component response regulator
MSESGPVVRVVDDDLSFLAAVARLLKAAGYTVQTFSSAAELLAKIGDTAGCVIADLRMPAMDGLDLQQALLRGTNVLPVIFLTAEGDIPATVKAMRQGAEDFLTKRGPKEDLFAAVKRAIARDARQRAERDRLRALRALIDTLTSRELGVLRQSDCTGHRASRRGAARPLATSGHGRSPRPTLAPGAGGVEFRHLGAPQQADCADLGYHAQDGKGASGTRHAEDGRELRSCAGAPLRGSSSARREAAGRVRLRARWVQGPMAAPG